MTSTAPCQIDALRLRRVMGRDSWKVPEPFGPSGFRMHHQETYQDTPLGSIIVTQDVAPNHQETGDLREWIHASMAFIHRPPSYDELTLLKRAVWRDKGTAYQVFAAADEHVNIHEYALHLWGHADGSPALPRFGALGTI